MGGPRPRPTIMMTSKNATPGLAPNLLGKLRDVKGELTVLGDAKAIGEEVPLVMGANSNDNPSLSAPARSRFGSFCGKLIFASLY